MIFLTINITGVVAMSLKWSVRKILKKLTFLNFDCQLGFFNIGAKMHVSKKTDMEPISNQNFISPDIL